MLASQNPREAAAQKVGVMSRKMPLSRMHLELRVGHTVAMLDGVCAGIDRHLNASVERRAPRLSGAGGGPHRRSPTASAGVMSSSIAILMRSTA